MNAMGFTVPKNVAYPAAVLELREIQTAAIYGVEVAILEIRRSEDIAPALEAIRSRADA
jgi:hypothetical protein